MTCSVAWTPAAEADLHRLDVRVAERIAAKIEWLSENADTVGEFTGCAERIDMTAFYGPLRAGHTPMVRTSEAAFETVIAATQG